MLMDLEVTSTPTCGKKARASNGLPIFVCIGLGSDFARVAAAKTLSTPTSGLNKGVEVYKSP